VGCTSHSPVQRHSFIIVNSIDGLSRGLRIKLEGFFIVLTPWSVRISTSRWLWSGQSKNWNVITFSLTNHKRKHSGTSCILLHGYRMAHWTIGLPSRSGPQSLSWQSLQLEAWLFSPYVLHRSFQLLNFTSYEWVRGNLVLLYVLHPYLQLVNLM